MPPRYSIYPHDYGYRRDVYHHHYYHRPQWYATSVSYNYYSHNPYYDIPYHHGRWATSRNYFYGLPYSYIYWDSWLRFRVDWDNGYRSWNDYPYYVYNGYLHRYSNQDQCDYELVDGYSNQTVATYHSYTCNVGYDQCADLRDSYNQSEGNYRYFCSEKLDYDQNYDYGWDYSDDFYSDLQPVSTNDYVTYRDDYSFEDNGYSNDGNYNYNNGNGDDWNNSWNDGF